MVNHGCRCCCRCRCQGCGRNRTFEYRHGTNWDPLDWSSSNKRLPADLAAAKQSVQQEERVKAALKASTEVLAAKAKREKQRQRRQQQRHAVDAANADVMDVDANTDTATVGQSPSGISGCYVRYEWANQECFQAAERER